MSSVDADVQDRLEKLEIAAAHQEETIADLNRAITEQWAEIDGLRRLVKALVDQIQDVAAIAGEPESQKPPPHY